MTVIPEKKDAVFVRGVVIACGMQDDQNDTAPDKAGIKKIFSNYLQHESDVQHSYIKNFHVHQLENTITSEEITIADQKVPAGSWIASHMVINPKLKQMILDGTLNGYSLGAIGDKGLNENQDLLNKSLMYEDLKDYDELNPLFISFVKKASNGFNWEVFDYTQFLNKSSYGDIMTEENKSQIEDEKISLNGLERIKDIFGLNKESSEEEETVEETPADEEMDKEGEAEAEPIDISNAELLEKLPQAVAEAVISALSDYANKEEEQADESADEELNKEGDSSETSEEGNDEDNNLEKSSEQDEESSNEENNEKLNKKSSKIDEMPQAKAKPKQKFLDSEKRDAYGRVRKYL